MICPNCKNQIQNEAEFCMYCGVHLVREQPFVNNTVNRERSNRTTPNIMPENHGSASFQTFNNRPSQAPEQKDSPACVQQTKTRPHSSQQMHPPGGSAYPQNVPYPQHYANPQNNIPIARLKTNRSFIKTFLLSLVTFGIYALITYAHITDDVNTVCSRYDNRKSMNYYLLFFLVGPITIQIATIIWMHNLCDRIGKELKRRNIDYNFGAKDFWLWGILGALILVGPFIFMHKFFTASNKMNESFNQFP